MKKIGKYVKKGIVKRKPKYFGKALKELFDEMLDFIDDFSFKKVNHGLKKVNSFGRQVEVRPAYLFAQKVEYSLKFIFGISMIISAIMASFWGITRTSELLSQLIGSILGRFFLFVIGLSYAILGVWKVLNLEKNIRK